MCRAIESQLRTEGVAGEKDKGVIDCFEILSYSVPPLEWQGDSLAPMMTAMHPVDLLRHFNFSHPCHCPILLSLKLCLSGKELWTWQRLFCLTDLIICRFCAHLSQPLYKKL